MVLGKEISWNGLKGVMGGGLKTYFGSRYRYWKIPDSLRENKLTLKSPYMVCSKTNEDTGDGFDEELHVACVL